MTITFTIPDHATKEDKDFIEAIAQHANWMAEQDPEVFDGMSEEEVFENAQED